MMSSGKSEKKRRGSMKGNQMTGAQKEINMNTGREGEKRAKKGGKKLD